MDTCVRGNVVFPGSYDAPVSYDKARSGHVLICKVLTVEIARAAIAHGVRCIISNSGNPASHAANLIRHEIYKGNSMAWVSGVSIHGANRIEVDNNGLLKVYGINATAYVTRSHPDTLYAFDGNNELIDSNNTERPNKFTTSSSQTWSYLTLWPERYYTLDEYHLMRTGLERCASQLAKRNIVTRFKHGRIWFSHPALSASRIELLACTPSYSISYLMRMKTDYTNIIDVITSGNLTRDAIDLFFSTLLLFHHSYTRVLEFACASLPMEARRIAVDTALTNGVTSWLYALPEFTSSKKTFHDMRWAQKLPPIMPDEYILNTEERLMELDCGLTESQASWMAHLAILKEYKMIISKNIYALYRGVQ